MAVDAFTGQSDTQALYTLTQYDFGLVTNLSDDLKNKIQYTIWNGVAENQGIPSIAKALEQTTLEPLQVGNRLIDILTRAMMIVKTEAVRVNNQGLLLSFKQYGVQMADIITSPGVCDDCADIAANGPYPIDNIPDGGPPFHPNCCCTLIAASDPTDTATDPESYFNLVNGSMVNFPTIDLLTAV
jgi:hypothetical protein